jgi:hypothetical protein
MLTTPIMRIKLLRSIGQLDSLYSLFYLKNRKINQSTNDLGLTQTSISNVLRTFLKCAENNLIECIYIGISLYEHINNN